MRLCSIAFLVILVEPICAAIHQLPIQFKSIKGLTHSVSEQRDSAHNRYAPQIPFNGHHGAPVNIGSVEWAAAVNISLGTPGQNFTLLIDSMASEILVLSSKCVDPSCPRFRSYDGSKSSSHTGNGSRFADPTFWEGIQGIISRDVIQIGDLHVDDAEFGEAIEMPRGWDDDLKFEGVLGLALGPTSKSGLQPAVKSLIESLDLDEPVFAFSFDHGFDRWTSLLTLGGYDETQYAGELIWLPSYGTGLWETELDSLSFGNDELRLDDASVVFSTKWMGLFFPWDIAQILYAKSHAKCSWMGFCTIECALRDSLPILEFVLSGQRFSLTPYEYTFEADLEFPGENGPLCVSAVFPLDPEYEDTRPQVQLGLGFLLKYYSVFNMTDGSIGLALRA